MLTNPRRPAPTHPPPKSAVEETLARIALMGGVEGFLITDGEGTILRQSKGLSARDAAMYATQILALTARARHAVRDLDPKVRQPARARAHACMRARAHQRPTPTPLSPRPDCPWTQDDLEFFRLRTKDSREILAAPGSNSLVIVIQKWKTAAADAAQ